MTTEHMAEDMVEIYIANGKYRVPGSATVMQAFEHAGFQFIRGCGCRGGVCGACSFVYRLPQSFELHTGLACQTRVEPGMQVIQIPFFPVKKADYEVEEMEATTEEVVKLYPEIVKCIGCNTCTKACPMEINVMNGVADILRGNIDKSANNSVSCTMCGLCAVRCPAGLAPYLYFLLCRRLYGRHIMAPFTAVPPRMAEIENGKYREELDQLQVLDTDKLKELYREAQADKRII